MIFEKLIHKIKPTVDLQCSSVVLRNSLSLSFFFASGLIRLVCSISVVVTSEAPVQTKTY